MPVTAILILLTFFYVVSTAAALVLTLMDDEAARRRYQFVPGLNIVWFGRSLLYVVTAQGAGRSVSRRARKLSFSVLKLGAVSCTRHRSSLTLLVR